VFRTLETNCPPGYDPASGNPFDLRCSKPIDCTTFLPVSRSIFPYGPWWLGPACKYCPNPIRDWCYPNVGTCHDIVCPTGYTWNPLTQICEWSGGPDPHDCPPGTSWDSITHRCAKNNVGNVYNKLGLANRYRAAIPLDNSPDFHLANITTPPINEIIASDIDSGSYRQFRFIWDDQLYKAVGTRDLGSNNSQVDFLGSEDDCETWTILTTAEVGEGEDPVPLFPQGLGYRHPDIVKTTHGLLFAAYLPDTLDDTNTGGIIKGRFQEKGAEYPGAEFTFQVYDRDANTFSNLRIHNNTFKLCESHTFENSISLVCQLENGDIAHLTSEDDGETWEIIPSEAS
jgi:hypothetical protein